MAPTWQTVPEDTLRIQYASGGWVRRFFGMLILLAGTYPCTWLVLALVEFVASLPYENGYHFPAKLIGLTLVLLTAAIFVVPGLLLTFAGKRLEIDSASGEVREMQDYVMWRTASLYDFTEISSVRGRVEDSRNKKEKYRVDLVIKGFGDGTRKILAARFETRDGAQILGDIMSKKLNIPFENHT